MTVYIELIRLMKNLFSVFCVYSHQSPYLSLLTSLLRKKADSVDVCIQIHFYSSSEDR